MSLNGFYLLPHPPIAIPEVGRGEEEKIMNTLEAFHSIGKDIAKKAPSTIILVTPHGIMFQDAVALAYEDKIYGDLKRFGLSKVAIETPINRALTDKIYELASDKNLPTVRVTNSLLKPYNTALFLDHGALVPLYFINQYHQTYRLVHITYAPLRDLDLYQLGMEINRAVEILNEDAVIIASGDLSHKLKEEGPYGYSPFGERFDQEFLQLLQKGDVEGILNMDRETVSEAAECGRRSVIVLLGSLDGKKFNGDLLSYEGTFGVGYGIMKFNIISEDGSKLKKLEEVRRSNYEKRKNTKDPYVRLARESLTTYLARGEVMKDLPSYVTDEMKNSRRGVFVSLKKHGDLRGCIGTIFPTTGSIAEEIIRNAIQAGINDPRFPRVREEELMDIVFSIDVLTEPETCSKNDLDPKEYGVLVRSQGRTGLLLPDLEEVDTVEKQLTIALQKAGIGFNEDYTVQRFRVIRHKED